VQSAIYDHLASPLCTSLSHQLILPKFCDAIQVRFRCLRPVARSFPRRSSTFKKRIRHKLTGSSGILDTLSTTAAFQKRAQISMGLEVVRCHVSQVHLKFEVLRLPRQCGVEKRMQKLKGPSSDALCNGVYVTPLHRASEHGRLEVVLVPCAHGKKWSIPRCVRIPYMDTRKLSYSASHEVQTPILGANPTPLLCRSKNGHLAGIQHMARAGEHRLCVRAVNVRQ
jgi:hypothetical protein